MTLAFGLFAQTGDPYRDKLDSIFKFIDKTQIPSGYLKEYGSEMLPVHCLNGVLQCPSGVFARKTQLRNIVSAKPRVRNPFISIFLNYDHLKEQAVS